MQHCSSGSMEKDVAIQGYVCGLPCSRQGSPKILKNPISRCCMWYWWGHAVSTLLRLLQVSKYQGMAFVGKAGWFSYGLWPSSTNHPQSAFPAGGSARRQPPPLECSPSWSWCLSTLLLLPCQRLQDFLPTLCLLWCWAQLSPDHSCQGSRADDDIIIFVIVVTVIIPESAVLVTARLT